MAEENATPQNLLKILSYARPELVYIFFGVVSCVQLAAEFIGLVSDCVHC